MALIPIAREAHMGFEGWIAIAVVSVASMASWFKLRAVEAQQRVVLVEAAAVTRNVARAIDKADFATEKADRSADKVVGIAAVVDTKLAENTATLKDLVGRITEQGLAIDGRLSALLVAQTALADATGHARGLKEGAEIERAKAETKEVRS